MLVLRGPKGEIYNIFTKPEHFIGRRGGNLELSEDQSVSRQHASISVSLKDRKPIVQLCDLGSKYGTFIGDGISTNEAITPNVPITVTKGCQMRFGLQWNIWTMDEIQFVVCTSTLKHTEKAEIKNILSVFGGMLVSEWSNRCTHLTINRITVTIKVASALASVKPIVTADYWRRLKSFMCDDKEKKLLDCDDFVPPLAESKLQNSEASFKMIPLRNYLFSGLTFVTSSTKQYTDILPMVTSAGGNVIDDSKNRLTEYDFHRDKMITMQPIMCDKYNSFLPSVFDYLKENKLRMVSESEIALSIIFCSTDKHCNPAGKLDIGLPNIKIHDSEDIDNLPDTQIPFDNSNDFSLTLTTTTKRTLEESSDEELFQTPKRPAIENNTVAAVDKENGSLQKKHGNVFSRLNINADVDGVGPNRTVDIVKNTHNTENIDIISRPSIRGKTKSLVNKRNDIFTFPSERQNLSSNQPSCITSSNESQDLFDSSNDKKRKNTDDCVSSYTESVNSGKRACKDGVNMFEPSSADFKFFENSQTHSTQDNETRESNNSIMKDDYESHIQNSRVSLSQFITSSPKDIKNVELEKLDPEVKEIMNKTVVIIKPLLVTPTNRCNNSTVDNDSTVINYKMFRKVNPCHRSHVIRAKDLYLYEKNPLSRDTRDSDEEDTPMF